MIYMPRNFNWLICQFEKQLDNDKRDLELKQAEELDELRHKHRRDFYALEVRYGLLMESVYSVWRDR